MGSPTAQAPEVYRVWLAGYVDWEPSTWSDVPPSSMAIRPAEPGCMTSEQAAQYIQSFNQAMLAKPKNVWAVGVCVAVQYQGDLSPGQTLAARHVARMPPDQRAAG